MELTAQKKVTIIRWLLIILLLIILGGIVAGYIYLGMKKASVDETVVTPLEVTTSEEKNKNSRQEIIDSLSKDAPDNITPEDKAVIIDSLHKQAETTLSEMKRQAVLDSLKKE